MRFMQELDVIFNISSKLEHISSWWSNRLVPLIIIVFTGCYHPTITLQDYNGVPCMCTQCHIFKVVRPVYSLFFREWSFITSLNFNYFTYKITSFGQLVNLRLQKNLQHPIQHRIHYKKVLIYKALNGLVPQYLRDMYTLTSNVQLRHSRHTDNSTLYLPTGRNLQIFKDSFQYSSAEIWHNIPVEIREAQSLQSFNSAYIQWFLTKNP